MHDTLPRANRQLVTPLSVVRRDDLDLAGGKGANLGELVSAGFPVPDGFVTSTAAYDSVAKQVGVDQLIEGLVGDDGAPIRAAFEHAIMPDDVAVAITKAYADLGGGPVAVRSSATAEDL